MNPLYKIVETFGTVKWVRGKDIIFSRKFKTGNLSKLLIFGNKVETSIFRHFYTIQAASPVNEALTITLNRLFLTISILSLSEPGNDPVVNENGIRQIIISPNLEDITRETLWQGKSSLCIKILRNWTTMIFLRNHLWKLLQILIFWRI